MILLVLTPAIRCLPLGAHADVAQLRVELQRMNAPFAADARLLRSSERRAQIAQEPRIDPHDAGVDARTQTERARDIARPGRCREPVRSVIGQAHRFLFRIEWTNVATRAEDLLANDTRSLRQTRPDRRLDPGAAGQ